MSEPHVSYTVRELVERLDKKIDQFLALMTSKADKADVTVLEEKYAALEPRLAEVERKLKRDEGKAKDRQDFKRWIWPTLFGGLLALCTILSILIGTLH